MASAAVRPRPKVTIPQRPTRRAKAAVSYREDDDDDEVEEQKERSYLSDFDDEFPEEDDQPESEGEYVAPATRRNRASPERSSHQSSAKRRVITIEDSDEEQLAQDEDHDEGEGDYAAPATRRKRKSPLRPLRNFRSKKRRRAAPVKGGRSERREFSSDLSASDSNTDSEDDTPMMSRAIQKKPAQTRATRGRARGRPPPGSTFQVLVSSRPPSVDRHSESKIPDWKTLPYHVMLNIMSLVGAPLVDERDFRATENFKSVFNASQVCRSWSEAALTILWQDPVLIPMERAHLLKRCLLGELPFSRRLTYNYHQKIKHVSLEVQQTATYTHPVYGHFNIEDLVFNCPRLVTLEIYHLKDLAPYRDLDENIKWFYPDKLVEALKSNVLGKPTELKSWRWSSRLVSPQPITSGYDFTVLNTVHITPSFQSLKKLAFVNYQTPNVPRRKPAGYVEPQTEKNIADTIALLPSLKHLVFEACGIVNGTLLSLLPKDLYHLEIIACGELLSEDLASFLLTHGSQLRSLVLDHNQALSLSWSPILKDACPKLEILQCNLAYYNLHGTYKDNEPIFKELLGIDEIPTWPSTLRSIELTQLRKWEAKAAENLFNSLLNSAEDLPDLRVLIVKAIIDSIGWRDRGGFRDRWCKRFDYVFKCHSSPPRKELRSLGAYRAWLAEQKVFNRANKPQAENPLFVDSDGDECDVLGEKLYIRQPQPRNDVISDREIIELSSSSEDDKRIAQIRKEDETDKRPVRERRPSKKVIKAETAKLRSRELERLLNSEKKNGAVSNGPEAPYNDDSPAVGRRRWLAESERNNGAGSSNAANGPQRPDDDEPIAVRRRRRRIERLKTEKKGVKVLADGRSVTTTGGTRYGRDDSLDVDTSYHSEGSIPQGQFVQGMCDIVELRIDNLRPTENQFTEADFLDSEPDEDGDWNGEGGDENGWVW